MKSAFESVERFFVGENKDYMMNLAPVEETFQLVEPVEFLGGLDS